MNTTIGVDLGKNVIQVSVVNNRNKELLNKELTRKKFAEFFQFVCPFNKRIQN